MARLDVVTATALSDVVQTVIELGTANGNVQLLLQLTALIGLGFVLLEIQLHAHVATSIQHVGGLAEGFNRRGVVRASQSVRQTTATVRNAALVGQAAGRDTTRVGH